ncbi:hypothetical protein D9M71_177770 [compost metagenome]
MAHLAKGRGGIAANALGRRLRRNQLGVRFFESLQLTEQAVVLGIGNARFVEYVVAVVVRVEFAAQLGDAFGSGLGVGHRKASSSKL